MVLNLFFKSKLMILSDIKTFMAKPLIGFINNMKTRHIFYKLTSILWTPMMLLFVQMLSILLGLLVLSPPSSAMMRPYVATQEDGSTPDPNTFWPSEDGKMSPIVRDLPPWGGVMPSGGQSDNVTAGANKLRMFDPSVPPMSPIPDLAICDMLLNAPVPAPVDQIPLFCLCSHCKGTVGPKGDRGDRGPAGTWITFSPPGLPQHN